MPENEIQHSAPVPPFVTFVTSAVPMVFDNSMSYYEALCALWKWLQDDVINVINNNASVTEDYIDLTNEYTQKFIELKNYVDTYFDNLDVQEEINNKLDAMVEDGTLQNIIYDFLQSNVAWTFDTVADMKLATNLINGAYARTLGFHSLNDGGGALYKITNSGTANEMDVIAIGSLFANLILPTEVSPEIYGAYGDGTHDDTASIQRAIDQNKNLVMNGDYLIASSIYIGNQDASGSVESNINIDAGGSSIEYTGNGNAVVISGIKEGKLNFGKITTTTGNCIELWSTNGNVSVSYLTLTFKELRAATTGKAFYIHSSATGFINQNKFIGGAIFSGNYGFYIEQNPSSGSYRLNGNQFDTISYEGCTICYSIHVLAQSMRGFRFNNDRTVENLHTKWIEVEGTIDDFIWNTWSRTDETKIDFTNATPNYCKVIAPLWNANTNKYEGSGIFVNGTMKKYLYEGYTTKTLTKESGVTGTILIIHTGNNYILNFVTLGVDSASKTLVLAANNPLLPNRRYYGTITDTSGNSARITLESNGDIKFVTSGSAYTNTFDGQLIFDSFAPESI